MVGCGTTVTSNGTEASNTTFVVETFIGSDVTSNNNTIYLYYRPLTSTNEVSIKVNGSKVTYEVDYAIPTIEASPFTIIPSAELAYINDANDTSDGLTTGTIKYLKVLSPTDTVEVSYKYRNWDSDRFTAACNASLSYYLTGKSNIVPGTEQLSIYNKNDHYYIIRNLIRNSHIGVLDGQYRINYANPPSITFNSDPIFVDANTYYLDDIIFSIVVKKY
jgi:hypothetical protein